MVGDLDQLEQPSTLTGSALAHGSEPAMILDNNGAPLANWARIRAIHKPCPITLLTLDSDVSEALVDMDPLTSTSVTGVTPKSTVQVQSRIHESLLLRYAVKAAQLWSTKKTPAGSEATIRNQVGTCRNVPQSMTLTQYQMITKSHIPAFTP